MLMSMQKAKNSFLRFKEHPEILCEYMLEDLEMQAKLGPLRYYLILLCDLAYFHSILRNLFAGILE